MAKAAFAFWNDRIAPVFDVARSIYLVETEGERIIDRKKVGITGNMANLKASCLAELGVETLVCGAISKPLQVMISAYGIQVIPFVAGDLQEVIQTWVNGKLAVSYAYTMPGCRKALRHRRRNFDNAKSEENKMGARKGGKRGAGQGGKGQQRRQGNRPAGAGSGGGSIQSACVCTICGHVESHKRGVPCASKKCPTCDIILTRQ